MLLMLMLGVNANAEVGVDMYMHGDVYVCVLYDMNGDVDCGC